MSIERSLQFGQMEYGTALRPRMPVDTPDPCLDARIAVAERHVVDEDVMERLLVVGRQPEHRVLQERKRDAVRGPELPEEVVTSREQRLEAAERGGHLLAPALDLRR